MTFSTGSVQEPEDLTQRKRTLRQWALAQRQNLPMTELSLDIQKQLQGLPVFQAATVVLTYWAKPGEVDLNTLIPQYPEKQWFLPRVGTSANNTALCFYRFEGAETLVPHPAYGIAEPTESASRLSETAPIDILILPGLAYDRRGHRLGYGKGYYDRYLASSPTGPSVIGCRIGVLPEALLLDEDLPNHSWDWPVDVLVTEHRVLSPES